MTNKKAFHGLWLIPILLLPGCFSTSEKKENVSAIENIEAGGDAAASTGISAQDGSPVLMKVDGRPEITLNGLDADFDKLLEQHPEYKQVLAVIPNAKENFFKGMVGQKVVNEFIRRERIDMSPEYQKELKDTMEQVKLMLNMNFFNERHPVDVSDSDARKFYDENKDKIPDLVQSQGGVKAEGVSFNNEADAQAFQSKALSSKDSIEKLASEGGYSDQYNDFKLVNFQSAQIDPALKSKILKVTSFPSVELFNAGNNWWVVAITSKVESTYVPFDKVKPMLKEHLKKQKQMESFEKLIEKYKKEYNVEINDAPLKTSSSEQAESFDQGYEEASAEPVVQSAACIA